LAAAMGVRIKVQSLWPKATGSTFIYEFAQSRIVIGRSPSADVQLPHAAVSGTHASIREQGAGYALFDEGSTNGTRVNEALLVPGRPKTLRPNDLVDLGGYRLTIEVGVPVTQTMSARLTADFARKILAEQLESHEASGLDAQLVAMQGRPDERIELLPIPKELPSEPPPPRESRPSRSTSSRPESHPPQAEHVKLGRGELAVYALAALVVVTSVVAMALLMRS
jgi:predicted component of type VI protein secretion system